MMKFLCQFATRGRRRGSEDRRALRRACLTGRPLGGAAWIKTLETDTGRDLAAPPTGRPRSRLAATAKDAREGCDCESRACPWFRPGFVSVGGWFMSSG
jgi:hypothetical protein